MMKTCPKCNETKNEKEFTRDCRTKDKLRCYCKMCDAKYHVANKKARNARRRKRYAENSEAEDASNHTYYMAHKESVCAYHREYYKENRFSHALHNSANHAGTRNHTPCRATVEELKAAFNECCDHCGITEKEHVQLTGRRLCIDHCHLTGAFRGHLCTSCNNKDALRGPRTKEPKL